jgi:YHS domain-containing protein
VQDPQCGLYVDSKEAVRRKVPDGELFFCSKDCADTYFEDARHGA